jgi:hypothetical protein
VGEAAGTTVGEAAGTTVGEAAGTTVGEGAGATVGEAAGTTVGEGAGTTVGEGAGTTVGDSPFCIASLALSAAVTTNPSIFLKKNLLIIRAAIHNPNKYGPYFTILAHLIAVKRILYF